ncbi:MAG: hypothetical protein IT285_16080 [Bdellovibrionales bacterium]|nr:hypothetical protein [Bdellovibrionales bacterium]
MMDSLIMMCLLPLVPGGLAILFLAMIAGRGRSRRDKPPTGLDDKLVPLEHASAALGGHLRAVNEEKEAMAKKKAKAKAAKGPKAKAAKAKKARPPKEGTKLPSKRMRVQGLEAFRRGLAAAEAAAAGRQVGAHVRYVVAATGAVHDGPVLGLDALRNVLARAEAGAIILVVE